MSKTINATIYETHGNPADVLRVESRPWPTRALDEVLVQMRAAPINPADLNQIEGKISGATGTPGDTWIRRRRNSCRYRPERVSRRLGMGRISAEGRFLK
jgi:NADPH:quinone reductase-like Zn-dependent oxidoreductase